MFDRENAIGLLLLGLCAAAAGILIYSISTGTSLRYSGPGWLAWALFALFVGGLIYGSRGLWGRLRGGGGGRQWPDPMTGGRRRRWWRRGDRE